ncbi:MAG: hypothetical protein ACLFUM_01175 [Spirochaetaceae bacterium]
MKHSTVLIGICALLLVAGATTAGAENGLRPEDHAANPAFFAFGDREYAELGVSADASVANTVLSLSEIFAETIVIDLDELYEKTPDRGMRLASSIGLETHLGVKLPRLGFGFFTETSNLSRVTVPREFIGLIAEGSGLDEDYADSTELVQRSYARSGMYATYEAFGFLFGGKLGAFAPGVHSDTNTTADFELTTESGGTVEGEVSASGDAYTSFGDEGLEGVGFNVGLGVVRPDEQGKPLYGGAINSIPLVAARPGYIVELEEYRYTFTTESLLDRFENEEDPFDTDDIEGDLDTRKLDSGDRPRVHMPISLSGFYRCAVPVVDVVPTAEVVFGDYPRLNAEVNVEGNVFPANILSVGLGYRDFLWRAGFAVRAPLRVFELELRVRSVGTEMAGVVDGRGIGAGLSLALGY